MPVTKTHVASQAHCVYCPYFDDARTAGCIRLQQHRCILPFAAFSPEQYSTEPLFALSNTCKADTPSSRAGFSVTNDVALQADMLSPESLCGENQFFCDFCKKKADATRQLCLQQLPPYLCLSLQRFVFDMKVVAHFTVFDLLDCAS